MAAQMDFWFYVHKLNLCLDAEGETGDERRTSIVRSLIDMPPMPRQEMAREVRLLEAELNAINSEVMVRERLRVAAQ